MAAGPYLSARKIWKFLFVLSRGPLEEKLLLIQHYVKNKRNKFSHKELPIANHGSGIEA